MTFLDALAARLGYAKATNDPRPPSELLALAHGHRWDMPDGYTAEKQAKLYAALTWISTAVDRTAEIGSAAVFSVKKLAGGPDGDDEDVPNHPFELLLRKPNASQSRGEFLRDAHSWFKVTGNNYIFLNKPTPEALPLEMWHMPSQLMKPIPDGNSYIQGYEFLPPGQAKPVILAPWQIVHLKTWNPLNPFVGLSAVQSLALDSYGDIAQQKWNLGLFDKNAGKFPGVLAFKHMIANPEWDKMTKQRDEEWGGTNRAQLMMLRGVGDTVQWLPSALSQKEMEFLGGREFTKEEIYGKLAPGLASILAVNATEANAIAGKATLIEFGVWPMLDQLAQKITADILPQEGEELAGEFDDMRQTNRILDLQEQQEYAKYHTVNEVRAEYYDEDPLYLDESQEARLEEEAGVMAEQAEMNTQALAAQPKPARAVAKTRTDESKQPAAGKTLDPRGLLFVAQIGPATPLPGDTSQPPAPAQPPMMQQEAAPVPKKEAPAKADIDAELEAWERYALKHLGKKNARAFEVRAVPLLQAVPLQAALKSAHSEDSVRRVFLRERQGEAAWAQSLTDAIKEATAKL